MESGEWRYGHAEDDRLWPGGAASSDSDTLSSGGAGLGAPPGGAGLGAPPGGAGLGAPPGGLASSDSDAEVSGGAGLGWGGAAGGAASWGSDAAASGGPGLGGGAAGGTASSDAAAGGPITEAPDLWIEDPTNAWGSTQSWVPPQRSEEPNTGDPVVLEPDAWYRPPSVTDLGQLRHSFQTGTAQGPASHTGATPTSASHGPTTQGPATHGPATHGAARHNPTHAANAPVSAAPTSPYANHHVADSTGSPGRTGLATHDPFARPGVDDWSGRLPIQRRPVGAEVFAERHADLGEEYGYGPVLWLTAGWYALPATLHLIWLFTLDSDRQDFAWRTFLASLPWLFGAVVFSFAVAGLLRWAIVVWRTLTVSFAAAVIGAGVTTIAHSLLL